MADISLTGQRGTTIGFLVTVELNDVAIDITTANTVITFTAKRRRSDVAPLITKTYRANGGSDNGMSHPAGPNNVLQVDLLPAETDDFTKTEFLVFDVILTEASGRETPIVKGALTVRAGVGS